MSLLSRRRGARPVAHLPQDLARSLPRGFAVLGAVPLRPDGECWLVAAPHALLRLGRDGGEAGALPASTGWDRISRASWDAERRTLTLHLLHDAHGPRVLSVPDAVRRPPDPRGAGNAGEAGEAGGESGAGAGAVVHDVDERGFARVLRQRVDSAIVHHVSRTLPNGTRATASVRRGADGVLYSTTEPESSEAQPDTLGRALRDLERSAREAVGLPTR